MLLQQNSGWLAMVCGKKPTFSRFFVALQQQRVVLVPHRAFWLFSSNPVLTFQQNLTLSTSLRP